MRDEVSTAGKEILVGEPKFPPLGKCTMKPMNIHSDWMFNAFSGHCVELLTSHKFLILHLGVFNTHVHIYIWYVYTFCPVCALQYFHMYTTYTLEPERKTVILTQKCRNQGDRH